MMRRLAMPILTFFVAVLIPLAAIGNASAASPVQVFPSGCNADICKDNAAGAKDNPLFGPKGVMTEVIHLIAIFVGVVATISIVISGMMMIFSAGDATKVSNARRALTYALIGLAIATIAQGIVAFVLDNIAQ